jgi:type I restriction enzyme M protein
LSSEEEQLIINAFNKHESKNDFAVVVSYEKIKEKNYSFSAGQYFDVQIEYSDITTKEFDTKINGIKQNLEILFRDSKSLEKEIIKNITNLVL